MKKLICLKEAEEFIKTGNKVFHVDKSTLCTPSAKDAFKNAGVEVVIGECTCTGTEAKEAACGSDKAAYNGIDSELIYKALSAMFGSDKLNSILEKFMCEQKYLSETSSGLKIVRGSTVKMDKLDTGNPADDGKVYYQELISASDSSPMNAGFLTIEDCCFDWEVTIHEIYYVIDGSINVTIDGKLCTASAGDCLYAPKGAKVKFGSTGKVKVFYATY